MSTTLEVLRTIAAAPAHLQQPTLTPMHQVIARTREIATDTDLFAPAGQHLPAQPREQALLTCMCLSCIEPAEAVSALPADLQGEQAESLVWALADLFDFLRMERVALQRARLAISR